MEPSWTSPGSSTFQVFLDRQTELVRFRLLALNSPVWIGDALVGLVSSRVCAGVEH